MAKWPVGESGKENGSSFLYNPATSRPRLRPSNSGDLGQKQSRRNFSEQRELRTVTSERKTAPAPTLSSEMGSVWRCWYSNRFRAMGVRRREREITRVECCV
ncbi:hypothetical protein Adt_27921 [Abeliophyllum distichum]|uniref:Uncharacterized protein n=1 Tax=Abeliophyllum distichum TaxID=126358 RepID=A0ABD1RX47_9LAMI